MATIAWPASLNGLEYGWSETPTPMSIETQTDSGPGKRRARYTDVPWDLSLPYKWDATQMATFWDFYANTVGGGSLAFDYVNPRTGAVEEYRFRGQAPTFVEIAPGVYSGTVQLRRLVQEP